MGQSRPEDSSNRLNNQAGLKHGLALGFSRTRAQRASKSVRLARIRCCSFPHDQFLLQLLLLLLFYYEKNGTRTYDHFFDLVKPNLAMPWNCLPNSEICQYSNFQP